MHDGKLSNLRWWLDEYKCARSGAQCVGILGSRPHASMSKTRLCVGSLAPVSRDRGKASMGLMSS